MAKYVYLPPEQLTETQKVATKEKRWKENRVTELPDGYTWRKSGRDGFLYLREHARVLEIYYEISGNPQFDILLYWSSACWILPQHAAMTPMERAEIASELSTWLHQNNTRAQWS